MANFKSAEVVQSDDGRQYHTGVAARDVAPYILLCGDPARAHRVGTYLTEAAPAICNREYVTITGTYQNVRLTVMATGMGPDNTEMAVVEVGQLLDRPSYIRIGTCGALQDRIAIGDQIISSAAMRYENTSTGFVPEEYPAVADWEVTTALLESAAALGVPHHLGITATASGFYGRQGRRVPKFPPRRPNLVEELNRIGVLNFEMETSCLFTLATLSGARAGCVCGAVADRTGNAFADSAQKDRLEQTTIEVGLAAAVRLAQMDARRGSASRWLPSMGL